MIEAQGPKHPRGLISRADRAYVLLIVGPAIALATVVLSLSGDPLRASGTRLAIGTVGYILALLVLLVGAVMAVRSRWHRPVFLLGLYALALFTFLAVSNTLGFHSSPVVVLGGIVVMSFPILAAILATLWFARWRRRLVS